MPAFYRRRRTFRRYRRRPIRRFPRSRIYRRRMGTRRSYRRTSRRIPTTRRIAVVRKLEVRVPDISFNTVQRITISASEFEGLDPFFTLYNQFRIKKAIVRFIPDQNVNTAIWDGTAEVVDRLPTIVTAPNKSVADYLDGQPTVPDLRSYTRAKEQRYSRPHVRTFVPYVQYVDALVPLIGGQGVNRSVYTPWLATNNTTAEPSEIVHDGLLWGLSAPASIPVDDPFGTVEYLLTGVFEFKNPKPVQ